MAETATEDLIVEGEVSSVDELWKKGHICVDVSFGDNERVQLVVVDQLLVVGQKVTVALEGARLNGKKVKRCKVAGEWSLGELVKVVPFDNSGEDRSLAVVPTKPAAANSVAIFVNKALQENTVAAKKHAALAREKTDNSRPGKPFTAWDQRNDPLARSGPGFSVEARHYVEGGLLLGLAILDNALCYAAFFGVHAFHGRLYNIVDLYIVLSPALGITLVVFAAIGTLSFAMMVVSVECLKLNLFHETMNFRFIFSALPCGAVLIVLLYYSERTQWAPFAALVAIFCSVFSWCLHMRVEYAHQLNVVSKISLDISWFLALALGLSLVSLWATDQLQVVTKSDELGCPHAANKQMPVLIRPLQEWYCAPWDAKSTILRRPASSSTALLSCSDTFINAFGVSLQPHKIECPVGCLRTYQGSGSIVGCGVYAVDSPVCLAAIHAGALTDAGGQAIVYGRLGVPYFERCSRSSLASEERHVMEVGETVTLVRPGELSPEFVLPTEGSGGRRLAPSPLVFGSNGRQIPQAFHFNNLAHTQEFLWLKNFQEVPSRDDGVEADRPWTRIQATVSANIAGLELEDEQVKLGEGTSRALFVPRVPGEAAPEVAMVECQVRATGVLCHSGAGAAVLRLDFCRPEAWTCPHAA
eukprot:gnl/TRDRNA2_/TRDRNA2_90649_c1_seq2.p1 gnl/TRDRNA2_/TRDRNA2_90649_c1~~gnl/TRDRNA2_/TRDRNA2_90649_c1_seq2.p1  ORF type:complete len:654 (-),score=94.66 gnl/TRDRNA2_/TRDRNA2_90649_c1_seq2:68-1993(-)